MVDRDALRSLIRDVIESEVARQHEEVASPAPTTSGHPIRIENARDLGRFARHVLLLAEDELNRERILAESYAFQLAGPTSGASAPDGSTSCRIGSGLVTEATLSKLARSVRVLELAPGVVVTPLARERARALGILLERRSA